MTGDTVVVPRIDRLARNLTEGLKTIEELHAQGIHIRALAEGLDTGDDSPSSRLMLHMLLSLAEWERDTIRDRIRAGVDRAAAEGRTGGRTLDGRGERHRGSQQRAGAVPATVQSTLPSSSAIPRTCIPASQPGAVPGTGPCLKHSRRVARDNTVRFQLLPGPERPSYAGAAVEVLEGLDGRLLVRHEGRIVAAQEAPPSPVFLRNGHGRSAPVPVLPSGANGLGERWTATLKPLDTRAAEEKDQADNTGSAATASKPKATSPRKPTFLERERWKAIQKARRKGMSLRAIERELGIHRATVRKYLDAEGPPTRQPQMGPATSSSDTMAT